MDVVVGSVFDRWTVVGTEKGKTNISCECICGVQRGVSKYSLLRGASRSCGCFKNEVHATRLTTHGYTSNDPSKIKRLYRIWGNMLSRCKNPNTDYWEMYGGKGISVCPDWEDFTNFSNWANSTGYTEASTIDREDSSKDYCPENCRWTSFTIQARNRGAFKNSKSGYTGVHYNKVTSTWNVSICVDKKNTRVGTTKTPKEGALLRNKYITENNLEGFQLAKV